jgi:PAS domain S-box-containing protein
MHFYDLHPDEGRGAFKAVAFDVFKRKGSLVNLDNILIAMDGRVVWVTTNGAPLIGADGTLRGYRGSDTDITERKQAEDALRQSEERYRFITDNTSDSIWALGPDLRMIYQSPSTECLFGYTLGEWHKIGWDDYVHPDHLDAVTDLLNSFRRGQREGDATISVQVRDKHGKELWAEISASPVRGPNGEFAGVVGITRDITERKEAEERLIEYRIAVEQSADGIALSDLAGNIRFVNEAWARMHGYSVGELIGRHLSVFHTREQMESQVSPFNQRLRQTGSQEGEVWHVRSNGEVFATWMTTTLLKRADGEPFGMFAFARDITEQKEMERQQHDREIAEARADELGKSRRRLIDAQESLRKDIASQLHGTVQNRLILLTHRLAELEAGPASERTTEELAGIRHRLEELQRDHIRPMSHRLFPSILRLGIAAGLESLVDEYSSQLPIDLRISKNLRDGEQADRRLVPDDVKLALYRVADEVLVNTLKHTPTVNSIVMKLSLSDGGILRLTVTDDGSGFQEPSRSHGIGLALISDYAESAGGSCTVKSAPGKGTRVTAQVQLAETEAGRRRKGRTSG